MSKAKQHKYSLPQWELRRAVPVPPTDQEVKAMAESYGCTEDEVREGLAEGNRDEIWKNRWYQVAIRGMRDGELCDWREAGVDSIHLSIKTIRKEPIHDWRDFQQIKNELIGPEHEAVELYPAESRLIDTANQYHLWVSPDPDYRFPIGWNEGRHVHESGAGNARQRKPFEQPTN